MAKLEFIENSKKKDRYMTATELLMYNPTSIFKVLPRRAGKSAEAEMMEKILHTMLENMDFHSDSIVKLLRKDNG